MVHYALQALDGHRRRSRRPAAALICCLALLGGCGSSSHSTTRVPANTPASGVGASISLDNCTDWQRGTIAQRRYTVVELRKFAGGPVGSSAGIQHGPVLSDDRAYQLFRGYCANYFARGFKLYKLYTHAAGFVGH